MDQRSDTSPVGAPQVTATPGRRAPAEPGAERIGVAVVRTHEPSADETSTDRSRLWAKGKRRKVELVILGRFPERYIDAITERLEAELPVTVLPVQRRALPEFAYYKPRRRYRAELLLDYC